MRKQLYLIAMFAASLLLSGCGGGDSSSSSPETTTTTASSGVTTTTATATTTTAATTTTTSAGTTTTAAGTTTTAAATTTTTAAATTTTTAIATTTTTTTTTTAAVNTVAVVVDSGPPAVVANGGAINQPFVSVTICAPANPTNCQTIDHILLDTGSYGLRIISSVLSSSLTLPQRTDASGNAVLECATFADGYSWGTIKTANLQIGGETANGLAIQIIGDPNYTTVPRSCSGTGKTAENTVVSFGSNGVLGVGPFAQDCGSGCATNASYDVYYSCATATTCQPTTMSLANQVQNPVSLFATDNNGVILSLAAVSGGAATVSGTLTFGIGTQSNNALGSATIYTVNSIGNITTTYKGVSLPDSFLDSGSNGLFFTDNSIPQCSDGSGFYCPTSTLSLSAVNTGLNGNSGTVSFSIGNAQNFYNSSTDAAYAPLGGVNGDSTSFDWGLPFFYGRNVYTAIEGTNGIGPYFAY